MAGLLGGFGAKVGGLLGSPRVKDAFMMTLASGGNQEEADYLREQMAQKGLNEKLERMRELQMQQAEAQLRAQQEADARKQYTQALLTAGSSQNPALLQDPAFQSQLRMKAAAYGDPAMLQAGGLLAPTPTEQKETSLQSNLRAMGIDPMSAQGREIMMQSMIKPQTAVNVNTGLPYKLPPGKMLVNPDDPMQGVRDIPGMEPAVTPEGRKKAGELARLDESLGRYREALTTIGTQVIPNEKKLVLGGAHTDLLMEVKNLYELGVLNVNDYPLLLSVIKDPTSVLTAGQGYSGKDLVNQLDTVVVPKLEAAKKLYAEKYGQPYAGASSAGTTVKDVREMSDAELEAFIANGGK